MNTLDLIIVVGSSVAVVGVKYYCLLYREIKRI